MNNKGISPVIATVIIVAVAIAISIAVAFWMTGIVGIFTGTVEQLQVVSATQESDGNIKLTVKNAGTTTVTIDGIFTKPSDYADDWVCGSGTTFPVNAITDTGCSLDPGKSKTLTVNTSSNAAAGVSMEIKIHTATGKEYPKLIVLERSGS